MRVTIRRPYANDELPWVVNIPPTKPEHWEGDNILAPYGCTYWPTWRAAINFVAYVLTNGRSGSLWTPSATKERT